MKGFPSLILAASIAAVATACDDALCSNVDFGSCGNACCKLEITLLNLDTMTVVTRLNGTLSNGGPDGLYFLPITADGTVGFSDLRPYNISADFVGQAQHLTKNGLYTDTINYWVKPSDDSSGSIVRAFSVSQVAGAYGIRPRTPHTSASHMRLHS